MKITKIALHINFLNHNFYSKIWIDYKEENTCTLYICIFVYFYNQNQIKTIWKANKNKHDPTLEPPI